MTLINKTYTNDKPEKNMIKKNSLKLFLLN